MNKRQLIQFLEQRFLHYHKQMEEHIKKQEEQQAIKNAVIVCELANIMAYINNTTEDHETKRLNKKYNLKDKIYNI